MSTRLQSPEKEYERKLEHPLLTPQKKHPTTTIPAQPQEMPRQLESPLNAFINQRAALFIDELPGQQLESPMYALINQRPATTLAAYSTQELECPLYAQVNQRAQKPLLDLPAQLESPLNAQINGHAKPRAWITLKRKTAGAKARR